MNKACALLLLAAGVTEAAPVVGQYGDGNVANDEWDATVVGGDMNTASGKYATIGGGYMNYAKGDYATIAGGQGNSVISNYGSIMGGYANVVSGRFGTVLGGSKNTASGRHSAALGYGAVSSGDYSFTACFTGDSCVNDVDNSIAFFADNMYLNDVNLNDILPTVSRMLSEEDGGLVTMKAAEALIDRFNMEFDQLIWEVEATIANQDALLEASSQL